MFLSPGERVHLLGQSKGEECTWFLFVFSGDGCTGCESVLNSVDRFLSEGFGDAAGLRFAEVRVGTALTASEPADQLGQVTLISDPSGKFVERAGVVSFPGVVLVSPDGKIVATSLGVFRADSPGFEVLSHLIAPPLSDDNYPISLALAGFVALLLFLVLGYFLARRG